MAPTAPKFTEGEKVLCFHGPLLYEAKCVKTRKDGGNLQYFVHYLGWNKNWDEWVSENRILKITPENLEKKVKLLVFACLTSGCCWSCRRLATCSKLSV